MISKQRTIALSAGALAAVIVLLTTVPSVASHQAQAEKSYSFTTKEIQQVYHSSSSAIQCPEFGTIIP